MVVTAFAAILVVQRRSPPTFFLGGVLWAGLIVALSALAGIVVALTDGPPADPLHIVYGVLAVAALPGAALIVRGRTERAQTLVWGIAGLVLAILVLRLFQTSA
jgi:hypothetical protein